MEANILKLGYKPVVNTTPDMPKWYIPIPQYSETETSIEQSWKYEKQPEPDWNRITAGYIAEKYTVEAEIALLSRGKDTPAWLEHEDWVSQCKQKTAQDKVEWERA